MQDRSSNIKTPDDLLDKMISTSASLPLPSGPHPPPSFDRALGSCRAELFHTLRARAQVRGEVREGE